MKTSVIQSSWLRKGGFRLDCSPYLGGAIETEIMLESLSVKKEPLGNVTSAIFNGPKFSRTYVENPDFGVQFIGGSELQHADLVGLSLMSKKRAYSKQLRNLEIKEGMTLITCSGTIGKMAFARAEMEGIWASQHIMKVVPDEQKIRPGFLFAFLSSKFGVPLITSGTYGAIIQSIEPHHISGLSVPRLGESVEKKIDDLIQNSASERCRASQDFISALADYHKSTRLKDFENCLSTHPLQSHTVSSENLSGRLDTNFHRPYHYEALIPFQSGGIASCHVADFSESIVEPQRFKRIRVDDPSAIPLFGTGALGGVDPEPMYSIASGSWVEPYRVDENTLLIPRSGQIYGIIGTAYQPIGRVLDAAVTEDAIRINCKDTKVAGYLYLALRSPFGLRQLKARCFGGSIPHLDVNHIGNVLVPKISEKEVQRLGYLAANVAALRTSAIEKEREAQSILEDAIEKAGR